MRRHIESGNLLEILALASATLSMVLFPATPVEIDQELVRDRVIEDVVLRYVDLGTSDSLTYATALAGLMPSDSCRRHPARRPRRVRERDPAWLARLDDAELEKTTIVRDLYDDDEWLLAGVRLADGSRFAFRVEIDNAPTAPSATPASCPPPSTRSSGSFPKAASTGEVSIVEVDSDGLWARYAEAVAIADAADRAVRTDRSPLGPSPGRVGLASRPPTAAPPPADPAQPPPAAERGFVGRPLGDTHASTASTTLRGDDRATPWQGPGWRRADDGKWYPEVEVAPPPPPPPAVARADTDRPGAPGAPARPGNGRRRPAAISASATATATASVPADPAARDARLPPGGDRRRRSSLSSPRSPAGSEACSGRPRPCRSSPPWWRWTPSDSFNSFNTPLGSTLSRTRPGRTPTAP